MSTYTLEKTEGFEGERTSDSAHRTEEPEHGAQRRRPGLVIDVIVSLLVVLIGFAVFKTTGLYDGVASISGKIIVGVLISLSYVAVFRHALYSR